MPFDKISAARLKLAHPDLQKAMNEAIKVRPFAILASQRGRADQEYAFKKGNSKAHFGQSAHNWSPAIALDIAPLPVSFKSNKPFIALAQEVILPIALRLGVKLRWGGDWNMDGSIQDGWDFPHFELHPWRAYAKQSKPFEG